MAVGRTDTRITHRDRNALALRTRLPEEFADLGAVQTKDFVARRALAKCSFGARAAKRFFAPLTVLDKFILVLDKSVFMYAPAAMLCFGYTRCPTTAE